MGEIYKMLEAFKEDLRNEMTEADRLSQVWNIQEL